MKINVIIVAMAAVIFIPVLCLSSNLVIIGHPDLPASTLSKNDVMNIFLGRKTIWNDNTKIVTFIQNNSATHDVFLKEIMRKSSFQYANYWKKQVLTGRKFPPKVLAGDNEVIQFVSETVGAIGYVSSEVKLEKVKTLNVKR